MALSIFTISKTKQVYQYGCCCPISYFSGMPRSHPTALSFCHPCDGKQPHHLAITNFISQAPKKISSQMFLSLPFFTFSNLFIPFPRFSAYCLWYSDKQSFSSLQSFLQMSFPSAMSLLQKKCCPKNHHQKNKVPLFVFQCPFYFQLSSSSGSCSKRQCPEPSAVYS